MVKLFVPISRFLFDCYLIGAMIDYVPSTENLGGEAMRVTVKLLDGGIRIHTINGSLYRCQKVVYAMYGRLHIKQILFHVDGLCFNSPFLVNDLEHYNAPQV